MSELTIHTGFMGDSTTIHVDWSDHNNKQYHDDIVLQVDPYDKPRTLRIIVNGKTVWKKSERGELYT